MTGGLRTRWRLGVAFGLVLVLATGAVVWFADRSPLEGDAAWQATPEELGLNSDVAARVSAVAGDHTALEAGDSSTVVDAAGDPVLTDLPAPAWVLREDASGWGLRFGASDDPRRDALALVAWDADGEETTLIKPGSVEGLLAEADIEVDGRQPRPAVQGYVDDVVAIGGCHDAVEPDERFGYVLGLDTRSGDVLWSERRPGRCFALGTPQRDAGAFIAPKADIDPFRVLDTATGQELWQAPEAAQEIDVLPDRQIFWWTEGTLHRLDPESGATAWSRQLCAFPDDEVGEQEVTSFGGVSSTVVLARCGGTSQVVDVETGVARELRRDTSARTVALSATGEGASASDPIVTELEGLTLTASTVRDGAEWWSVDVGQLSGEPWLSASGGTSATLALTTAVPEEGRGNGDDDDESMVITFVHILDANTGETLAQSRETDGTWDVSSSEDGPTLVTLNEDGQKTLFLVRGSG